MSFSSDSRAASVPYVLNRLVRTFADNIKYTAPPPDPPTTATVSEEGNMDQSASAPSGDPSKPSAWKNKFKLWGKSKASTTSTQATADTPTADEAIQDAPEPTTLARRIQDLIDSLPPPGKRSEPSKRPTKPPKPVPPTRDSNGRLIPPPGSTPIKDNKLIALLSSPPVMNGDKECGRESVWSVLEKLHSPSHRKPEGDDDSGGGEGDDGEEEDDPSLMLYAPLIPTKDSKVEVATSTTSLPVSEPDTTSDTPQAGWWPWNRQANNANTQPAGRKARIKETKVWVPSTTKISVQTMWWGYKIYLPPPILDILNDKQIEATKRAAMLTTALKWLIDNVPTSMIPVPLQPALLVLQRIVPLIGYIGGFIAWSWSTIKSYDEGLGVILTATWILPVALIPGTWRKEDVPSADPNAPPPANPANPPPPSAPSPVPAPANPSTGADPAPSTAPSAKATKATKR